MTPTVPKEFDLAYRELFTHPQLVEDLLRHFVKEPWVEDLDFSSLKRESEISVVRRKSSRIRDVVWSVHFGDRTLYILILLEFQSSVAPIMALRQLIYVATIYEDLYKQKRFTAGGKLPPVLPIVLYNGEGRWSAPLSVEDMIEKGPEALARYQPRMSYFFLDERRTKYVLTEDERNTIAALLALGQSEDGVELSQVVCLLVNSLREPENESLRQAFKSLILRTLAPELAPIAEIFDHPEEAMTARQRIKEWFENEKASNIATGLEQGRSEGRVEGQRRLVEKLLRLKFGALSAEAQARHLEATRPMGGARADGRVTRRRLALTSPARAFPPPSPPGRVIAGLDLRRFNRLNLPTLPQSPRRGSQDSFESQRNMDERLRGWLRISPGLGASAARPRRGDS